MWLLKDTKGNIRYLKPNKVIKVGRKDADIILENDSSISRAHASICVTLKEKVQTFEQSSTCLIKDVNSKYGSFIIRNGTKMKVSKEGLEIHQGDTLTFGLQNCIYSVEYIHFVTVISRLNTDHKHKLKSIMDEIGGIIIDFYDSHCTHLTATTAATTSKIISSLISAIPIVGINYWIQLKKCIDENKALPDPNPFVLSLQDAGVCVRKVSLKPNPLRKTLFQGKTFVFFTEKSFKEYKALIQQAGGTSKVYSMTSDIPDNLFSDSYIIMKVATNDSSAVDLLEFDTFLQNKVKEKNIRTVNETEIPLAIIYASLAQYCNPKYDFTNLLKRKGHVQDTSEVLALDTQDLTCAGNLNTKHRVSKPNLIPETLDIQHDSSQSPKRNEKSMENNDGSKEMPVQMKATIENDFPSNTKVSSENKKGAKLSTVKSSNSNEDKKVSSPTPANNEDDLSDKKRNISNKRQRQTSECDDINENIQQFWPSKKKSSIDMPTAKTKSGEMKKTNVLKEVEPQVAEEHDNKKTDKWGFKKSNKKARDFDLDDIDIDGSQKIVKKSRKDVLDSPTRESRKDFDLDDIDVDESDEIDKKSVKNVLFSSTKLHDKNESEQRSNRAETILEPEKDFEATSPKVKSMNMQNKGSFIISHKNQIHEDEIDEGKNTLDKPSLIMNVKNEVDGHQSSGKIFQKKYDCTPGARIPLAEMTIWRPK